MQHQILTRRSRLSKMIHRLFLDLNATVSYVEVTWRKGIVMVQLGLFVDLLSSSCRNAFAAVIVSTWGSVFQRTGIHRMKCLQSVRSKSFCIQAERLHVNNPASSRSLFPFLTLKLKVSRKQHKEEHLFYHLYSTFKYQMLK